MRTFPPVQTPSLRLDIVCSRYQKVHCIEPYHQLFESHFSSSPPFRPFPSCNSCPSIPSNFSSSNPHHRSILPNSSASHPTPPPLQPLPLNNLIQSPKYTLRLPHKFLPLRPQPFIPLRLHRIQLQNYLRQNRLAKFLILEIPRLCIHRGVGGESDALRDKFRVEA